MAAPSYVYQLLESEDIRWNGEGALGSPVTITFSFPTSQTRTSYSSYTAFNQTEIDATRAALAYIASITNITFTEVSGSAGDIHFGNANLSAMGASGIAGYSYNGDGIQSGSVTLNNTGQGRVDNSSFTPGSISAQDLGGYGWATLLHEIGHVLGLKHTFAQNDAGDPASVMPEAVDDTVHTLMSYTPYEPSNVAIVTGNANSYSYTYANLMPRTYGVYDIAALQYLYGADTSSTGGKTFAFLPDQPLYQTISDRGANNTIDLSAISGGSVVDMRQGAFSDLAIEQNLPYGITLPDQYDGSSALSIAYGVVIANFVGGAGVDRVLGNGIGNRIDGGGGADILRGARGDDVYIVDNVRDRIYEFANEGRDRVEASVNHKLADHVEDLLLTGAALRGAGNALANEITGNSGANILDGGGGADRLTGGLGDDTYYSDGLDTIVEAADAGVDRVYASASAALSANVETLFLTGAGAINGTGNGLANRIVGNDGANQIRGLGGGDTLTGGLGADTFVYTALADSTRQAATRDTIADFSRAQGDRIDLSLIDANALVGGDQAFTYIGSASFSRTAGQLQAIAIRTDTLLSGDVNGDGVADFSVYFTGAIAFNAATDIVV